MNPFQSITEDQLLALGLDQARAKDWHEVLQSLGARMDNAQQRWQNLSSKLSLDIPFAVHWAVYQANYADSPEPGPAWIPDASAQSNLSQLIAELHLDNEADFAQWSRENKTAFWEHMVQKLGIQIDQPYSQFVDLSQGVEQPIWMPDARFNIVDSCFQAPQNTPAIIQDHANGKVSMVTYGQLQLLVNQVANSLRKIGLQAGDAVGMVMPMSIESVAVYLGLIRAGCVAVSIAESFAAPEIERRLQIANAKAVFTQDVIRRGDSVLPLYEKMSQFDAPLTIVLPASELMQGKLRENDMRFREDFLDASTTFESVKQSAGATTNILFSSGTTGDPKAIPWTQTTPIKAAVDGLLYQDIQPDDIVNWPTSLGWMMGPWLIYASLINRATLALYTGHPGSRDFCRFVQDVEVTVLGVVPSLVTTWKSQNCLDGLDWSKIKVFSSTGECSNAQDMLYLMSRAGYRPIIEYCGGTELGGAYLASTVLHANIPSCFSTVVYGMNMTICDEDGAQAKRGEAYLEGPALGMSTRLLNRDHHKVYYSETPTNEKGEPLRRHGDEVEELSNGYYRVLGRTDDTMNLGGIKVSAAEIERIAIEHELVKEVAAIAVQRQEGGPTSLVLVVVPVEVTVDTESLRSEIGNEIKQRLNPLFKVSEVVLEESLPRTASNKVMRRELRATH